MIEGTYIETSEQYKQGVVLDEYGDKISICSAQEGKDGKTYLEWAFPQDKDRKPRSKSLPWKVTIGDKQEAIRILKAYVAVLEGKEGGQEPERTEVQEAATMDAIPF